MPSTQLFNLLFLLPPAVCMHLKFVLLKFEYLVLPYIFGLGCYEANILKYI